MNDAKKTFGPYQVEAFLGEGAIGLVYKAYDLNIKRAVAIKTIREELLGDDRERILARFKVEAQAAGQLLHPKIVAVYGYGEEEGTPYIVMEYARGRTLKELLDQRVGFELKDVVMIVLQLLDALDFSHQHHIVHRDIKPANIIMDDGKVKVTDFGIAKIEASGLTVLGDLMGTPNYMSPEQWHGLVVDHRTDIFSVGVLLYQLLAGEKPFAGDNQMLVRHKTLNIDPPPPSKINPYIPSGFDDVVMKALAKQPADRFQTAQDFLQALRTAYDRYLSEQSDDTVVRVDQHKKPRRRRLGMAASLILTAAIMLGGIGLWIWNQTSFDNRGTVSIRSEPEGAVVTLSSGEFLGVTPISIQLDPGEYQVVLKKNGYSDLEASLEVEPRASIPVDLTLNKQP